MTPPRSPVQRLRRRRGVRLQVLGPDTMLLDPDGGGIHVLNDTASLIWSQLEQPCSEAELEAALRREFEVPEGVDVRGDVARALEELRRAELVEPA